MNLKENAKILQIYLPALFIAMQKKTTPISAKIIAGVAVGYALSPIDLIPDFIPVLGYLDDLLLLPLLVMLCIRLIPREVMEQCKTEAKDLWHDGKPKKWYYGIPILIIWIGIVLLILSKILDF